MKILQIVLKELFQRNNQLVMCLIAVSLGVAVVVAIESTTLHSEKAVSGELDALGANILILPKDASVQDYYSADFQQSEIPESYVTTLVDSNIEGIDNLSPKLSVPVEIDGRKLTLTGILPKNEFKSKVAWQGALGIFTRSEGCGIQVDIPGVTDVSKTQVRRKVIDDLGAESALIGSDVSSLFGLKEGDSIDILGHTFKVETVLPATGTVDDGRVFAHLHTVQNLVGKPALLNAIEIVGCCSAISDGLITKLNKLLPDAKVVTVTQIVQTQLNTTVMMKRISLILLIVIFIVGGAIIANFMFANVFERRREIGIYMALGAGPRWIMAIFLLKALLIGIAGGVIGYIAGTLISVFLGPQVAGIPVLPVPQFALYSLVLSTAISLAASAIPAKKATTIDPAVIMKEE